MSYRVLYRIQGYLSKIIINLCKTVTNAKSEPTDSHGKSRNRIGKIMEKMFQTLAGKLVYKITTQFMKDVFIPDILKVKKKELPSFYYF